MSVQILYASDRKAEAEELLRELSQRSFFCTLLGEGDIPPLGISEPVVLVIVSPGFLASQYLKELTQIAIMCNCFIPVIFGQPESELPLWIKIYSIINLNNPTTRGAETERLVHSIMFKYL